MDMVWAIRTNDADWLDHNFRGYFNLKIHIGLGNTEKMAPVRPDDRKDVLMMVVPASDDVALRQSVQIGLACLSNIWEEYVLDTCYDAQTSELVFKVEVPNNSYLSIGFGPNMTNTDMIVWEVYDGEGSVRDLYSKG